MLTNLFKNTLLCCCTLLLIAITYKGQAQAPIQQYLNQLKVVKDTGKIYFYKRLVDYYVNANPDSAIILGKEGVAVAKRIDDKSGEAWLTVKLGYVDMNRGDMELSYKKLQYALKIYTQLNEDKGLSNTNNALGIWHGKQAQYEQATKYFLDALTYTKRLNNPEALAQSYVKLGIVNEHTGNLDKALEYYMKGLEIIKGKPHTDTYPTLLNNIGILYAKQKDTKKAMAYFAEGITAAKAPELAGIYVQLLSNLGNTYQQIGDKESALKYQKEALAIATQKKWKEQESNMLINIASLSMESHPDSTEIYLNKALIIIKEIGQKYLELDVYKSFAELYKSQQKYKEALDFTEKRIALKDSLFSLEKSKQRDGLEAAYGSAESKIRIQKLELENQKSSFEKKIFFSIATASVIILTILTLFFFKTRRLNAQLMKQQAELKAINNVKDKMFSVIGHDLRSPLSNVISVMEIFDEEKELYEKEKDYLTNDLKLQSKHALEILDKLLLWGQSQLTGTVLKQEHFSTANLIGRNVSLAAINASKKLITITDKTIDQTIYADESHFDFIIRNLLANAVKFTPEGGKIEIETLPDETKKGFVTFAIKDNGVGMSQESLENLFTFVNISKLGTANEKGTGIGLVLSQEFIKENGGTITAESEIGKGSTFYISFKK